MIEIYRNMATAFCNLGDDSVDSFRDALLQALFCKTYKREDLLFDIRGEMLYHKETMDQNYTQNEEELKEAINTIKNKARVCQELGIAKPIMILLLTDFADLLPYHARTIVEADSPVTVRELIKYAAPLADDDYERFITQSFALGFVENVDLKTIKDAKLSQTNLKCFYKLTNRSDIRALLGSEHKREIATNEFGL